jgi:propionyl-CoA carboxylase beta chain
VILPEQTREKIVKYLGFLKEKKVNLPKRKHGNIPL